MYERKVVEWVVPNLLRGAVVTIEARKVGIGWKGLGSAAQERPEWRMFHRTLYVRRGMTGFNRGKVIPKSIF